MPSTTEAVIQNHLRAARQGVDAVLEDYDDDAVLVTPVATYRGLPEIRQFFEGFLDGLPSGFFEAFEVNRQEVEGDVGYILWEARPWLAMATDTFLVREGKIRFQTFASHAAS